MTLNPAFQHSYYLMTIPEPEPAIDRRLLIATGILLAAIERRQE